MSDFIRSGQMPQITGQPKASVYIFHLGKKARTTSLVARDSQLNVSTGEQSQAGSEGWNQPLPCLNSASLLYAPWPLSFFSEVMITESSLGPAISVVGCVQHPHASEGLGLPLLDLGLWGGGSSPWCCSQRRLHGRPQARMTEACKGSWRDRGCCNYAKRQRSHSEV